MYTLYVSQRKQKKGRLVEIAGVRISVKLQKRGQA
jgi:hypothetical protein